MLVCKKIYAQDMDPTYVKAEADAILSHYGEGKGNWHRMYMGQVVEAYTK